MNICEQYERNNIISVIHLFGKQLGKSSDKSFVQLNPKLKKLLEQFIDEKEWELLRKKCKCGLFTIENVENLSQEEIKAYYETTDKLIPLSDLKEDLYQRVYDLFDYAVTEATLIPDVFENMVASNPLVMLIPMLFFVLGIFSGIYASHQYTNGWWLISGYCIFLGLINLDSAIRTKQITAALRGKWSYIPLLYLLNPIAIILFIIHFV